MPISLPLTPTVPASVPPTSPAPFARADFLVRARNKPRKPLRHSPAILARAHFEDTHWYRAGRRELLMGVLQGLELPAGARIMEVACGTGANLPLLARFGRLAGVEADRGARLRAAERCGRNVSFIESLDASPGDTHFDLVCLLDALAPGQDPAGLLLALRPLLARRGRLLMTLPASSLACAGFEPDRLRRQCARAGYKMVRLSRFNLLPWPFALLERLRAVFGNQRHDGLLPAPLNWLAGRLLRSEAGLLERGKLPVGASLLCLLEPEGESSPAA